MRIAGARSFLSAAGAAIVAIGGQACARSPAALDYDLSAQSVGATIQAIARTSGANIAAPSALVRNRRAGPVKGHFTADEALSRALTATGLHAERTSGGFVIRDDPSSDDPSGAAPDNDIVVTGTRIRGASVASPVVVITGEDARDSGQATLGEIVRSVPQSSGGGQNPGIGLNVPASSGVNVGGGSSLNLRGLGSDATLTLLNGHRLPYSGSRQSIDVSTIPLGAVDRLEIVPDGASALYGSDAVGGVANIILRRDMDGVEARARLGAATAGGDFDQQYGVTGGARWTGGGFLAAYEFNRTSAIDYDDRDYAVTRSPGLRLLPSAHSNNVLASGHQQLAANLDISIDGLYNDRSSLLIYSYDPSGDLALDRVETRFNDRAFAIAPALSLTLGAARISLAGTYAKDRVAFTDVETTPDGRDESSGCYCNRAQSVELAGDGSLLHLPGGDAKVALGIGYRNTYLKIDRGASYPLNFAQSQADYYGYGELSLPIFSAANDIAGVSQLSMSAAARWEHYTGIGNVTTPKFGLIYAPVPALDLKASWGKSFRAPTLIQRYQPNSVSLVRASSAGGSGFPAASTVFFQQGGGPDLRPERATSWTVSATLHPSALRGFSLELSYFAVRYTDRIVVPVTFLSNALSDPLYAALVNRAPSAAHIGMAIADAAIFSNSSGAPYDPASVVAIVDDRTLNAGSQPTHGIDMLLDYHVPLGGSGDSLTVTANTSYLVSRRQIGTGLPYTPVAGTIFNPPHWRGRGSIGWRHRGLTITSIANYVGGLSDPRFSPAVAVPAQATFDLAVRYQLPDTATGLLRGLDLTLSAQNLFDRTPPLIATTFPTETPYDSTNYSAIGRFISIAVSKRW